MNNLNIHPATREDVPALLSLIRGLAAYEKKTAGRGRSRE
jgi:hypothetical protein